jgi:hypothetical protein
MEYTATAIQGDREPDNRREPCAHAQHTEQHEQHQQGQRGHD